MSDLSTVPTPEPHGPKRPWTILGRLAQAVREQNWVAVVLEMVIVIVGVVVGFQVTGWGQERANRDKEQTYLRQLSRDLAETERQAEDLEQTMAPLMRGPRRLAQAYFLPDPPPRDSVITWAMLAPVYYEVSPVLGTAEALVASGDIGLIRDDSLRTAITAYLEQAREDIRGSMVFRDLLVQRSNDFATQAPFATILAEYVGPAALDSLDRADNWMALAPPGVPLPALDTDAFVRDVQIHRLMVMMVIAKENLAWYRERIRRGAAELRAQVEAELNR